MKHIVTMRAVTQVAMVIEAKNEDQAEAEAIRLAKSGEGEFLNQYLDPMDFLELPTVCPVVEEIKDAAELGYGEARAANRPY